MKTFEVIGNGVTFHDGVLGLTDEQYKARAHALEPTKKEGEYRVVKPTQFKRGEKIGYGGDLPKALLQEIAPMVDIAPGGEDTSATGGEEKPVGGARSGARGRGRGRQKTEKGTKE